MPPEAVSGDKLKMMLPQGQEVQITIPHGAASGATLTFELPAVRGGIRSTPPRLFSLRQPSHRPCLLACALSQVPRGEAGAEKAAVLIQARIRGAQARKSVSSKPVELGGGSEEAGTAASGTKSSSTVHVIAADAARLIQATIRGKAARRSLADDSRAGGAADGGAGNEATLGAGQAATPGFGECPHATRNLHACARLLHVRCTQPTRAHLQHGSVHGQHTRTALAPLPPRTHSWSTLYPASAAARFEHSRHGPNLSGPQNAHRGCFREACADLIRQAWSLQFVHTSFAQQHKRSSSAAAAAAAVQQPLAFASLARRCPSSRLFSHASQRDG